MISCFSRPVSVHYYELIKSAVDIYIENLNMLLLLNGILFGFGVYNYVFIYMFLSLKKDVQSNPMFNNRL